MLQIPIDSPSRNSAKRDYLAMERIFACLPYPFRIHDATHFFNGLIGSDGIAH
jgi:hypothetical protein